MHALIIDDSRTMRSILRRIVTPLGFRVHEAGDGKEALTIMNKLAAEGIVPELCMVDWNMPVMDGYQFICAVRANREWRGVSLMMVTTESEQSQIVRALAAGAHEYVIKPFTAQAIADKLTLLGLTEGAVA